MKGLTRHRFSPNIPIAIWLVVVGVCTYYKPIEAKYGDNFWIALLLGSIVVLALVVVLVLCRVLIKWKRDGFGADLFFSLDWLSNYVPLAVFYLDAAAQPFPGDVDLILGLLFLGLSVATVYRWIPGPFDWLWGLIAPGGRVYRPDVLGGRRNVDSVKAVLTQQEHGIFCGEIYHRRKAESLYVSAEDRGIVIGPPGTGKTAFMVTQLLDLAERRGSFVCLDIKSELHQIMRKKLMAQGYRI